MQNFYDRQILLDNFGSAGQAALAHSTVVVVGLGGLGCAAAQQLVAMGLGKIILVDGDSVSASNLSRQILYSPLDVNGSKVAAAKTKLKEMRPDCEILTVNKFLTPELCEEYFPYAHAVVDSTDNFAAKFLINAAGAKFQVPVVWANAQKWEGQIAIFNAKEGSCYRCLVPVDPQVGAESCNEIGVMGVVPNLLGCLQALECVKILCEIAKVPLVPKPKWGELQSYSFRDSSFYKTKVLRKSNCSVCSKRPEDIILPKLVENTCCTADQCPSFSLANLKAQSSICLIDVRERDESVSLPIKGALLLPLSELETNSASVLEELTPTKQYALFCKSGKRSRRAYALMTKLKPALENLCVLKENAEELFRMI